MAALVALLLHTTPSYSQQLSAAHGVVATGFGTPPVLTKELAEGCKAYVRTLVHNVSGEVGMTARGSMVRCASSEERAGGGHCRHCSILQLKPNSQLCMGLLPRSVGPTSID